MLQLYELFEALDKEFPNTFRYTPESSSKHENISKKSHNHGEYTCAHFNTSTLTIATQRAAEHLDFIVAYCIIHSINYRLNNKKYS